MTIERLEKPSQIASLIGFDDNSSEYFPCERGEWIQWLGNAVVSKEKVLILVDYDEDGIIVGYVVAINTVKPPLSRSVQIIYMTSKDGASKTTFVHMIKQWAEECGVKRLLWQSPLDREWSMVGWAEKFSCKKIASVWEHTWE